MYKVIIEVTEVVYPVLKIGAYMYSAAAAAAAAANTRIV